MKISALLFAGVLASSLLRAGDWPQWRGPQRNAAVSLEGGREVSPAEPRVVWKLRVGGGFSSPVVANGKLAYADAQGETETLHVLDAAAGRELWSRPFSPVFEDEWGRGPRSTPFFDEGRVYALSCRGDFVCYQAESGVKLWEASFEKDFGVKFLGSKANEGTASRRGNNGSALADLEAVILPVGNTNGASLAALNKETGSILWKGGTDEAAYSSPLVATLAGRKQIVAFMADALVGLDRENGAVLWRAPLRTAAKRHAMTPLIAGDNIYVNSHTFGLICFQIAKEGEEFKASEVWKNRDAKINLASPILVGDYLYSHGPAQNFVCIDRKTGKQKWSQPGFGKEYSAALAVGKTILVVTDDGQLVFVAADPAEYRELGRWQVCGKTWSAPAFANGRLYVRDGRDLICLDVMGGG